MRIGIVGSGRIGANIGTRLAAAGHDVLFSYSRDPDKLEQLADALPSARSGTPGDAVSFGETLVFSIPWSLVDEVLGQMGPLEGKVVIDTTNQFGSGGVEQLPDGLSAAETNARRMPGASLAKAFNTLTAAYQRSVADGAEGEVAMFYAAEDRAATPPNS